jgi:hypothetical protein
MGAGVSWADDHDTHALSHRTYTETSDLQSFAEEQCGCMKLTVHVGSRDEYTDVDGNTHSEWAIGRQGTVMLDVHARSHSHAEAWANRHQTADGSSWETADDLGGLVYNITYDHPGLIADLESEGYDLDLSEYTETPIGLIRTTYEIVTPESAEQGDAAERGFEDEDGTAYTEAEAIDKLRGCEPSRSAFSVGPNGEPHVWYTEADGSIDYSDGSERRESFHLVGFPAEVQRRIFEAVTKR